MLPLLRRDQSSNIDRVEDNKYSLSLDIITIYLVWLTMLRSREEHVLKNTYILRFVPKNYLTLW